MNSIRLQSNDLPLAALNAISARQRTYIDEFSFYKEGNRIVAYYAGDKLAVWDGTNWIHP
jgi:hypothetical protein